MAPHHVTKLVFFIVFFISFSSCKKNENFKAYSNELLSFKIESSLNEREDRIFVKGKQGRNKRHVSVVI